MLDLFHPLVAEWFRARFREPTDPQRLGWPEIIAGRNALIAAPTGSGKTLSAFLVCIDRLVRQAVAGRLRDETQVVYVSPLKALSNDITRNLQRPLEEIAALAVERGYALPPLRAAVRTGDTTATERQALLRRPPHILVTTPESLYLLLTSARGRENLRRVQTLIVDEIHALARDKRGSHLTLSLERLAALCERPPVRIGLSATQRPMETMARFLCGVGDDPDAQRPLFSGLDAGPDNCRIIDTGHQRNLDLAVAVPPSELSAVCSNDQWDEVYERVCEMINTHCSTLVFVNTRRLAERVAHQLTLRLGENAVASHHGSLSKEIRLSAEQRLAAGELKAIVATASLELGIDVGYIDLMCQIGSPRSIATFLQRVGRSGHSLGALPKGRLFPLTRDELLECLALVRGVRSGRLDTIEIPQKPLDILAQQIVAEVAARDCTEDELFELFRRAWPYRDLPRAEFDEVVTMLSEGIGRTARKGHYLHRDRVHGVLKARRGARIAALTSGGAIPELADYRVVTAADGTFVGTVNEDFAIESMKGDIFLLGNTSWRILGVRTTEVVVEDAQGAPATIPFWLGEAPGRTFELSQEVSRLREDLAARVMPPETPTSEAPTPATPSTAAPPPSSLPTADDPCSWLERECGADVFAASQAAKYVAAQVVATGLVPTCRQIVFERFFDESGGMQLVIHAPLGARINRAWGLAMRKRFCRSFDFELQASADDNGVVLSLGPQHSFPLEHMFRMLNTSNAEHMLTQAMLAVPMFKVRWRWNVTRSLAVLRQQGGKRVPPPMQRFRADDLMTAVFPAQTACQENRPEDIEIPDHPLVRQTVHDCLTEAMDLVRWRNVLGEIESGGTTLVARDTREPSPFSYELLNANPYAFLDPAPLEERRARAVATRRSISPDELGDLAWLDPAAIARVRAEAWPLVRDPDELHDALLQMVALPELEGSEWQGWFGQLMRAGRATKVRAGDRLLWVSAERLHMVLTALPGAVAEPPLALPAALREPLEKHAAITALVRGRMEVAGPVLASDVAEALALDELAVTASLEALEGEGAVLRGRFTNNAPVIPAPSGPPPIEADPVCHGERPKYHAPHLPQWCDRRLLARIHRLTLDSARRAVQPATVEDYLRFLTEYQRVAPAARLERRTALAEVLGQLQGFEAPAGAWEQELLPSRLTAYDPGWLDDLALSGEITWGRLQPPPTDEESRSRTQGLNRVVPICLVPRADLPWLLPSERGDPLTAARANARAVHDTLSQHGALFFHDLLALTRLLPAELEDALGELAALGAVTADGFSTIRGLVETAGKQASSRRRQRQMQRLGRVRSFTRGGRWCRFPGPQPDVTAAERVENWARQLLRRYGVLFRDLLARESVAPPWRDLVAICRRWEAQGKIRGGRFVLGVGGEQYALPEAVKELRRLREEPLAQRWVVVSAHDPLNLAGIITPGARIPAVGANRLAIVEGRIVAAHIAGEVTFVETLEPALQYEIGRALRTAAAYRRPTPEEKPRTQRAAQGKT